MNKKQVTIAQFAEILGVDKSLVYRAISEGKLETSVKSEPNRAKKVEVYGGVIEWQTSFDVSKSRKHNKDGHSEYGDNSDIPSYAESRNAKAYYSALNEELSFKKDAGDLVDCKSVNKQFYEAGQMCRDRVFEAIDEIASFCENKPQHEIRKFMKKRFTEDFDELAKMKIEVASD